MKEIWALQMCFEKKEVPPCGTELITIEERHFAEYRRIYNECFFPMRHELDIEPYCWFADDAVIEGTSDIYILEKDGELIGSVACRGNEIDDLIVKPSQMRKGYGRKILLWAMRHIRRYSDAPIILHVAEKNENAAALYASEGFAVSRRERVR